MRDWFLIVALFILGVVVIGVAGEIRTELALDALEAQPMPAQVRLEDLP
jgi:hypothetical protein